MPGSGAATATMPLQVRGRFLTAVVLPVTGAPGQAFFAGLDAMLGQTPRFFAGAPLVLDLGAADAPAEAADLADLVAGLRARGLFPVAVQNADAAQAAGAAAVGLVALQGGGRDAPVQEHPPARSQSAPGGASTLLITEPVRSGQRVYAPHGDLVVVASVGSGAELIAGGSIHVYGRLRGRALAGVDGDSAARVFCQSLEAELVAIDGLYRTSDDFGKDILGRRVQAFLEGETLRIEPLR